MRVLRLSNSQDIRGEIPPGGRAWEIAARMLEAEVAEPVETTLRVMWPRPELPGLIESWIDRYEPDMVFLWVSYFWASAETLSLQLEKKFGPVGKLAARPTRYLAEVNWFKKLPPVEFTRRLARRTVGGAAPFTAGDIEACIRDCLDVVLARNLPLVVRGPSVPVFPGASGADLRRAETRRLEVDARTRRLCEERGLTCISEPSVPVKEVLRYRLTTDPLHLNPEGQARNGKVDGEAMLTTWRAHRPTPTS